MTPPEALFMLWFLFGHFAGYDLRNCEFYERYTGAVLVGDPAFVRCEGPPLPPSDAPKIEPVPEPKPLPRSSVRSRTARR